MKNTSSSDGMDHPLIEPFSGGDSAYLEVRLPVGHSKVAPVVSRKAIIASVSIAVIITVTLAIVLPLTLRVRQPIRASTVILDALQAGSSATTSTSQAVVIGLNAADSVLVALSNAFSGQSITIAGVTITEVSGVSASAELAQIDPLLASLPIGQEASQTLYVVSGTCGAVVGLNNVACALIAYDPAIGSDPSALLQDAHAILAVMVSGSTYWSPAQLSQLQGGDTSALSCISWSGGGTVIGSAQTVPGLGLVQGLNFAVGGSGSAATSNCPLFNQINQLVAANVAVNNMFVLVTMPYQNWLAGATMSVTVASSSFGISLSTDTVSVALNNVVLSLQGLSAVASVSGSGQLVLSLPNTQALVMNAQGSWSSSGLQLSGNTPGWAPNPFGLTFLSLGASQFSLSLPSGGAWSVQFSANANLQSGSVTNTVNVLGGISGPGTVIQVSDNSVSSLVDVMCAALGTSCPTNIFADLSMTNPSVSFTLATAPGLMLPYGGGSSQQGFSVTLSTSVTGSLLQTLQGQISGFPTANSVTLTAYVPVFTPSNLQSGTVITLNLPTFAFNSQLAWQSTVVTIYPLVVSASLTATLQLQLSTQPAPLSFAITGGIQIGATGVTAQFQGQMQGAWNNAFTVTGLTVSNTVVTLYVTDGVPSVGFGTSLQIGTVTGSFYGDFDVGQGQVGVQASISNLMLSDMVAFYNDITGASTTLPPGSDMGFTQLSFMASSFTGVYGSVNFQTGLSFTADAEVFGNTIDVSMTPAFAFQFQFDNTQVQSSFLAEVETVWSWLWSKIQQYITNIFSITNFGLQNFSLQNLENGVLPSLCVNGMFLDNSFNECVPLSSIQQVTQSVYTVMKDLEMIVDPQCVINENCSNGAYCNHDNTNGELFTCAATCPNGCVLAWGCTNSGNAACT